MAADTHDVLREVVAKTSCKKGWSFRLVGEDGALRLYIRIDGYDNYDHDRPFSVNHVFPVPTATYNEKSWRRWVFEMCRRVENHELGECFRVGDERPFQPCHGPGEDPYTVHEYRDEVDARTVQDGSVRDK